MKFLKSTEILKRFAAVILAFCMLPASAVFAEDAEVLGSGTETDPYIVTSANAKELLKRGCGDEGAGVYFKLSESVSAAVTETFNGILDGNETVVSSLYFDEIGESGVVENLTVKNEKEMYSEPFVKTNIGVLRNINFRLMNIHTDSENLGSAAVRNMGTIERCRSSLYVQTNGSGAGGLVYFNDGGTIRNCVSATEVYASGEYAGGIAAKSSGGLIENCVSIGKVSSEKGIAGGIVGECAGTAVRNCIAAGKLLASVNAGGLFGIMSDGAEAEGCYFASERSETGEIAVGNTGESFGALSLDEIGEQGSYAGYDFENEWTVYPAYDAPVPSALYGSGTEENPYLIYCDKDLKSFDGDAGAGKYLRLKYAANAKTMSDFKGVLDGGGFSTGTRFALLDEGAAVKNVTFTSEEFPIITYMYKSAVENCTYTMKKLKKLYGAGGFVGVNDGGMIKNCSICVERNNIGENCGLLAHINKNGAVIENCTVSSSMEYFPTTDEELAESTSAALVWRNDNAEIKNCTVKLQYYVYENPDKDYETENNEDVAVEAPKVREFPFVRIDNGTVGGCAYEDEIFYK